MRRRNLLKAIPIRRGFTLLEVLLALGLSVILLTAVYSAMDLYWSYSTAGQIEVERSQLARTLLKMMASDIRSVVYREDVPASETTESEGSTESEEGLTDDETESGTTMLEDPAEAYATQDVGVFGDSTTLVLHIDKPVRNTDYAPATDDLGLMQDSDLQSVSWFLAGSGTGTLQSMGDLQGLARLRGDRSVIGLADEQGDLASLGALTQVLAAEVNFLEFQYFDGLEWLPDWDSVANGGLPLAIGITIGFAPPPATNALFQRAPSTSTETYRLVVALPLAAGYVAEAGL